MKKYIKSIWRPLLLAVTFSILGSVFAVRVQFLKGDVLNNALSEDFYNTLRYGLYLGIFIACEIGFFYLYDRNRGKFAADSMKEVRIDYFDSLLAKDYPNFLSKKQREYIAQYTNEMEMVENLYFGTIPMLAEIMVKIIAVSISLFILDFRIAIVTLSKRASGKNS